MGYREGFIIVTTPSVPGYRIKKVLGVVTGLTPRTRGVGGKFVAGIQSILGGEVSAFTSELEKARIEAIERAKENARRMGANAIVGLDIETSEVFEGVVVISVTGTAVIIEPE
ncbi:MAG: YbjQ family protein [archaeon]|nr:YbjQ family protein [archaeon]MCP8320133.1 YbjQ family protein [archaeon]